jgi:hypothetical protein
LNFLAILQAAQDHALVLERPREGEMELHGQQYDGHRAPGAGDPASSQGC